MNMPHDADYSNPSPSRQEIIDQLLGAITHEEMALANFLNAGASKIHAFIGADLNFPTHPSNQEIISMNKSSLHLLRSVVIKDWFLLNKLEEIFIFDERQFSAPISGLFDEEMNEEVNEELNEEVNEEVNEVSESEADEENEASSETEEKLAGMNDDNIGDYDESQEFFRE